MQLRAGAFTLLYEEGFLRYISYGKTEVLRMIYFSLRDENWGTFDIIIKNENIKVEGNDFHITYDCYHQKNGIDIYCWKATISGNQKGQIIFEIDGCALADFLKNRLGFCVLHPIGDYTGQQVQITHPDNIITQTNFPEYIASDSPFKQIKRFKWQTDNRWYNLDFEGDVFETEDQRNWTDASFKTFCTPLNLPFPVKIKNGEETYQKITFSPVTDLPELVKNKDERIQIIITEQVFKLPDIGIAASTVVTDKLSEKAQSLLRGLQLKHYSIIVEPSTQNGTPQFFCDIDNAQALQLPLCITLQLGDDFIKEVANFIALCHQAKAEISTVVLLSKNELVTQQQLIDHIGIIKAQLPGISIGVGTDYNFKEINRCRFDANEAQFVSYSIHPQEHAFDDQTLIENIVAQAATVRSTKNIYGEEMPVYISPVTFKKRFNPYATDPTYITKSENERTDARQKTNFGALFTLGSIKNLTIAKVSRITYFQTIGDQGIISVESKPFPVYYALKSILNSTATSMVNTISSNQLVVDSLLLNNGILLLWNYTTTKQTVLLPNGSLIGLEIHEIKTVKY